MSFGADARESGYRKFRVDVLDVSEGGCRIFSLTRLNPGTRVWIAFHGLSALEATVVWRDGDTYGCSFQVKLYPAVFEHLLKRAGCR